MASLHGCSFRKIVLLHLLLSVHGFVLIRARSGTWPQSPSLSNEILSTRHLLEVQNKEEEGQPSALIKQKKKSTTLLSPSKKNQTKLIKPGLNGSAKNQTKSYKVFSSDSPKNKTKLLKSNSNSTGGTVIKLKSQLKKYNSSSKASDSVKTGSTLSKKSPLLTNQSSPVNKPSNSTKKGSIPSRKASDLTKLSLPNNQTTKSTPTEQIENLIGHKTKIPKKTQKNTNLQKTQKLKQPNWRNEDGGEDLIAEFRGLPSKFQDTLLPDLVRISTTSKAYLNRANKQIRKGVKPIVGNQYATTIASIVSFAFIIIPLILVTLVFNCIKAYVSLQKLLVFVQVYLSIYFSILCLSSLGTGLEPLRFFYATSQSTYICLQVLQTLAYVLYLLLLLTYLIVVFSTESGIGSKVLVLGQTIVGFSVGLHYYVTVFHRAVRQQSPKTNWRVHGIYATCFLLICMLSMAQRRKKAYLEDGGEEGKKN